MANLEFDLAHGLQIGDVKNTHVVLRDLKAGDVMEASELSEKLVIVKGEPEYVVSPTLMGAHLLCRHIVKLGEIDGPLSLSNLKMLHNDDVAELQRQVDLMDKATMKDGSKRGRLDPASSKSKKGDAGGH